MDEEKLILLVSNHQELYDLENKNYMNVTRKNNIWQEISKEIGVQDTVCKERWKNLRDCYNRNVKKRKNKSGDGATKNKKWKFEDQMQFLLPYLQERATKSNFEDVVSIISDENSTEPLSAESATSPPSSTSTATMFKTMSTRKKNQIQQPKQTVASVLNNYLESRQQHNKASQPENPMYSFFKAMADTVTRFSPDLQLKAKNKIYAIVSDMEFEDFLRKSGSSSAEQAHPVVTNPSDSNDSKNQCLNSVPFPNTRRPLHNIQVQEIQTDSGNIQIQRLDNIPNTDTFPKEYNSSADQDLVITNPSNYKFTNPCLNSVPSTSTQRPLRNNQIQETQIDSENIECYKITDSEICTGVQHEINDELQSIRRHGTAYIITSDGFLLPRQ